MPALTAFCNPDPHAVRIARELHQSENPALTVLFGSRARGDYAPGRSDVDILIVHEQSPAEEQEQRVRLHAQSLAASLYRGYWVPVNVVWMTLEQFGHRWLGVNDVVGRAMDHGIIFSNSPVDYGARIRRVHTSRHLRWAQRHLAMFLERQAEGGPNDCDVGIQAFLALQSALRAAVYAQGEWCPELYDIDMLIGLAARADPGFSFSPAIEGDVYSQYSQPRCALPVERPLCDIVHHRAKVEGTCASYSAEWRWQGSRGNGAVRRQAPPETSPIAEESVREARMRELVGLVLETQRPVNGKLKGLLKSPRTGSENDGT